MSTEIARVRGTQDLFTLLRIEDNYMVEKKESVQSKAREYRPITRDHMELIEDQIIEYHTELREVALEMMLTPKLPGVREQDSLTPVAWLEQFPTPTEHLTLYYAASGYSERRIAEVTHTNIGEVKKQLAHVMQLTGSEGVDEAVKNAERAGLIDISLLGTR